jgi:UDP-4-amino-4-deoxy-L-arabinose formyltransferase / UDP-glucuronic acid dehydrogenase (UDP-4-keto-hexauronic acid decarboxylating)
MIPPRIALFALTGFGNTVLPALCAAGLKPELLVTRAEEGPFPYYDEEPLTAVAKRMAVPCFFGAEGEEKVAASPPDFVLCATYHRLLRAPILRAVRWPINLHPSLLPRYRGPNPFYWVIRDGEASTGVTAHLMTAAADAGDIVMQEELEISKTETQGSLRKRLAELAARVAVETLRSIRDGSVTLTPQDETRATVFGRPDEAARVFNRDWCAATAERTVRALAPFPGLITEFGIVSTIVQHASPSADLVRPEDGFCRLRVADGELIGRLQLG